MAKNSLPEHIGNYKIAKELGRGSMGTVYLGTQESLGREIAIKVLAPEYCRDEEFLERFRREGRTAGLLRHPNIVQVFDLGESEGYYYIAMEYMGPTDLKRLLTEKGGKLPLEQALNLTEQLLSALDHAHSKGIVHRDVKPANILISDQGQAVLTDFSVAQMKFASKLTQTGAAVGTPEYMAPEQFDGKGVDGRADLYALGIIVYEMLSGVQPFHGDTIAEVMKAQLLRTPPDLQTLDKSLPVELNRLVQRVLEKNRDLRFATASDMLYALRDYRGGSTSHPAVRVAAAKTAVPVEAKPVLPLPSAARAASLEARQPKFCPGCAEPVIPGHRHCANCGFEVGSLAGGREPAKAAIKLEPLPPKEPSPPAPVLPQGKVAPKLPPVMTATSLEAIDAATCKAESREASLDVARRVVSMAGTLIFLLALFSVGKGEESAFRGALVVGGALGVPCLAFASLVICFLEMIWVRKTRKIVSTGVVFMGLSTLTILLWVKISLQYSSEAH